MQHSFEQLFENNRTDKSQIHSLNLDKAVDPKDIEFNLPEEIVNKEEEGLLWVIEKKGLAPSYVIGTAHVRDQENKKILTELVPILVQVDEVIVETNTDAVNAHIMKYQNLPQVGSFFDKKPLLLSQVIDDPQFINELKECLLKAYPGFTGFSWTQDMDTFQPWFLGMLIRGALGNCKNPRDSIDLELAKLAKEGNKKVSYLESGKGHIAITGCHWPISEQILVLKFLVKNFDLLVKATDTVIEAFYNRKMFTLFHELTNSSFQNDNDQKIVLALNKKVFLDRNPTINANSLAFIEKGNKLLAIGAGHLFGKTGLLIYLHQKGFKISCSKILRTTSDQEYKIDREDSNPFVFGKY